MVDRLDVSCQHPIAPFEDNLNLNDPNYLAQRHGLTECGEVIKKVENALSNFAKAATMP